MITSLLSIKEGFSEVVAEHTCIYSSTYQILMKHYYALNWVPQNRCSCLLPVNVTNLEISLHRHNQVKMRSLG